MVKSNGPSGGTPYRSLAETTLPPGLSPMAWTKRICSASGVRECPDLPCLTGTHQGIDIPRSSKFPPLDVRMPSMSDNADCARAGGRSCVGLRAKPAPRTDRPFQTDRAIAVAQRIAVPSRRTMPAVPSIDGTHGSLHQISHAFMKFVSRSNTTAPLITATSVATRFWPNHAITIVSVDSGGTMIQHRGAGDGEAGD